jgi:hypothetical protein
MSPGHDDRPHLGYEEGGIQLHTEKLAIARQDVRHLPVRGTIERWCNRLIEAARRGYRLRDALCDEIEIVLCTLRQLHGIGGRRRGRGRSRSRGDVNGTGCGQVRGRGRGDVNGRGRGQVRGRGNVNGASRGRGRVGAGR